MGIVADVSAWLKSEGYVDIVSGGTTQWPLYQRVLPDDVDAAVVLTEDGGEAPDIKAPNGLAGVGSSAMQDPGIQLRVRGAPWAGDATQAKALELQQALHGQIDVVMGSTRYLRVRALTSEPVYLGADTKGRPEFTVSLRGKSLV